MELAGVSIILSNIEFSLIAASAGLDGIFGIFTEEDVIDKYEVYRILNGLIHKGIIKNDGDKFIPEETIKDFINVIRSSEYTLAVYPPYDNLPVKFCYLSGEKILITEQCATGEGLYKFYLTDKPEFIPLLKNEGYLPDESLEIDEEETESYNINAEELLRTEPYTYPADLVIDKYTDKSIVLRIMVCNRKIFVIDNSRFEEKQYTISNIMARLNMEENKEGKDDIN